MTTTPKYHMDSRFTIVLSGILAFQGIMHLFWLPISTQCGQLAIPWLMSQGRILFDTVIEQRPPVIAVLLSILYRWLPLEPIIVLKLLNGLLVAGISLLLYVVVLKLDRQNHWAALSAVVFWAWWEPVYGNTLFYFENVLGLVMLLVILTWLHAEQRGRAWGALAVGLLLGLATQIKPQSLLSAVAFLAWLAFFVPGSRRQRARDLVLVGLGILIISAITVGIIAIQGNLESYLYWNWLFNLRRSVGEPLTGIFLYKMIFTHIFAPAFWLLLLRDFRQYRNWVLVGTLWFANLGLLYPNISEIHAMAMLPLLAAMSGLAVGKLLPDIRPAALLHWLRHADVQWLMLAGILIAVSVAWFWAGTAPYVPHPLGRGGVPAYDEFAEVAAILNAVKEPEDTLYVLPELDGKAQLHVMTHMLPPGLWVNGHTMIMEAPGMLDRLLKEWAVQPPDYIVYFPELIPHAQNIGPLVDFMFAHYEGIAHVEDVLYNGDALIYRFSGAR